MQGGNAHALARHRFPEPRRAEPADLRRPRVADRRRHGDHRRRRHRHRAGHTRRLSRRLGRPGDHARHRCLARPAGAGLRDLPGDDGRPQHVEHRHHPRRGLLDALRPRDPRRGAEPARARIRQAGRDRRRQPHAGDPAPHSAERAELDDGAGQPDDRRRDHRRGVAVLSRRRRAAAGAGLGLDAGRRPLDADGRRLVADRSFPASASCWSCWRRSCSATGCASASTRNCATCSAGRSDGPSAPRYPTCRRITSRLAAPASSRPSTASASPWTKARRSASSASRAAARPRPACRSSACCRRRRGSSAAASSSPART